MADPASSNAKLLSSESTNEEAHNLQEFMDSNTSQFHSFPEIHDKVPKKKPRCTQQMCKQQIAALAIELTHIQSSPPNDEIEPRKVEITQLLQQIRKKLKQLEKKVISKRLARAKLAEKKKNELYDVNYNNAVEDTSLSYEITMYIALFFNQPYENCTWENLHRISTFNVLQAALLRHDYEMIRNSTYVRLSPVQSHWQNGKKHITTTPVNLIENFNHSCHGDNSLPTTSIGYLENLASLLDSSEVFFLSEDHKVRVPIGAVDIKQPTPLLMRLEYDEFIADEETDIIENHNLFPSVYAGMCIRPSGEDQRNEVIHMGPTYIAIRKEKSLPSTKSVCELDFERLIEIEHFQSLAKTTENTMKPVVMIQMNGISPERSQRRKVILHAVKTFIRHDLDAIFIATGTLEKSACNRIQRRIAPFSQETASIALLSNYFATHLDSNGNTINSNLEHENVTNAGKVLAEVWNSLVIDDHSVVAEYIDAHPTENHSMEIDSSWYSNHVRESDNLLQIVKCQSSHCCEITRSNLRKKLPTRFIPFPILITETSDDLKKHLQTNSGKYNLNLSGVLTSEENTVIHKKNSEILTQQEQEKAKIIEKKQKESRTISQYQSGLKIIKDMKSWMTSPWSQNVPQ